MVNTAVDHFDHSHRHLRVITLLHRHWWLLGRTVFRRSYNIFKRPFHGRVCNKIFIMCILCTCTLPAHDKSLHSVVNLGTRACEVLMVAIARVWGDLHRFELYHRVINLDHAVEGCMSG